MWMPALPLPPGPKYAALAQAIAKAVRKGILPPGARLPARRALAERLGLNLSTVSKAYDLAAEMGVVSGEVGRGTYVRILAAPERIPWPSAGADALDMSSNFPLSLIEDADLRQALDSLSALPNAADLLRYHSGGDLPMHLAAGAAWMNFLGLDIPPDRVLITSGAIHAVFVALITVARTGDLVLVEELTSPAVVGACRTLGLRTLAMPLDAQGVRPDAFAAIAARERPRAAILMPNLQNPTLATMDSARRTEIVQIARRYGMLLIEDDVYGPLLPDEDRPKPLASLAPERTFYCTSLSKSVAPGLRLGYLSCPPALRADALNAIRVSTWMISPILGQLAAGWILSGTAMALARRQHEVAARRQALARRVLRGVHLFSQDAGLHVLVHLPDPWRADQFAAHLQEGSVAVLPGPKMSPDGAPRQNVVRISLCAIPDEARLEVALALCRDALNGR